MQQEEGAMGGGVQVAAPLARDKSHMHDICSDGNWHLDY